MKTNTYGIEVKASLRDTINEYAKMLARSTAKMGAGRARLDSQTAEQTKAAAIEAANFYQEELSPNHSRLVDMPLVEIRAAADNVDINVGTLSGTMVLQQSLPQFRYEFPELAALHSDFSAEPGLFNQIEQTRIVVTPAVEEYDGTPDGTGRPKGWATVTPAQSVDVPITLDKYIGVPIVFSQATLGGTLRRLFEEQAPAAIYAIGKYFVNKVSALLTPQNFNAYAVATADGKVPEAYATYASALKDFSMDAIDDLEAIFDANEVPPRGRAVLLNAKFHGRLRKDPRLGLFFAAIQKPEMVTEGKLPNLNGFVPVRAPWLPAANNLTGFALHKAGIVLKQRLPADWSKVLDVMIPGSVTTLVDPQTGLSCLLVQYVNLQANYAEWRLETLVGAGLGDKRGGLCITGQ